MFGLTFRQLAFAFPTAILCIILFKTISMDYVKYPLILHSLHSELVLSRAAGLRWVNIHPKSIQPVWVGANGCSPVCSLFLVQRLHRIHGRRPRPPHTNSAKQKNERTNPIPPNPNPAILVQRNSASIPGAVDLRLGTGLQLQAQADSLGSSKPFHMNAARSPPMTGASRKSHN